MTTLDPKAIKAASRKITGGSTFTADERIAIAIDVVRTYLAKASPALPAQPVAVPVGWHLVPDHPTDEMMQAGLYQASADAQWADVFSSYVDMVRIAPTPEALVAPSQQEGVTEEMVERFIEAMLSADPPKATHAPLADYLSVEAMDAMELGINLTNGKWSGVSDIRGMEMRDANVAMLRPFVRAALEAALRDRVKPAE